MLKQVQRDITKANMRKRTRKDEIKIIFREEFRRQTRRVGYRIFTVLVPAIFLLALIMVPVVRNLTSTEGKAPDVIGYRDPVGVLASLPGDATLVEYDTIAIGLDALKAGEVKAFFVIDRAYIETGKVEWYRGGGALFQSEDLGTRFRSILASSLVADRVEPAVLARVNAPAEYAKFRLDDKGVPQPDTKSDAKQVAEFFVPYIFALLLMISVFTSSGYLLQSVADEKENRMIEMMVTSVAPFSIMAGKVLALGAAGIIQVGVWFISAVLIGPQVLHQIPNAGDLSLAPGLLVPVLAFFIGGYFLFAVLMAGIGAAASSVKEATQFSVVIAIPNVVAIYGSALIVDQPNGVFARTLSYIPFTAPTAMMLRLGAGDVPVGDIIGGLIVLVIAGIGLLWVSARVFRAGLLLYGQRMTPAAMWRAIKQAG